MKDYLTKPTVKAGITAILTILISIACSFLGNQAHQWAIVVVILLGLIYLAFIVYYSTQEVNTRRINLEYERRIRVYESVMASIISICKKNSSDINKCIHKVKDEGKIDLGLWSFDKASEALCSLIYKCLSIFTGSVDFEVTFVKQIEQAEKSAVKMIAFANQNTQHPTIFGRSRETNGISVNCYHDIELFKKNSSDIDILLNKREIETHFAYASKRKREENKDKYNQYIGIPVFCESNEMKMIGLLQIVCLHDTKLGLTRQEIEEVANKYLVQYSHFFLLLYKMEKALLAGTTP